MGILPQFFLKKETNLPGGVEKIKSGISTVWNKEVKAQIP